MSRTLIHSLFLIAAVLPLGCSSVDIASVFGRKAYLEAGPQNPVVDIVCLWEPGEGSGLDKLPARGFAGQLLFLTLGSDLPAKVDGDIRVYIFDDQGPVEEQGKPLHQFDFVPQAFSQYFYETSFGAAYQLFLPYTRKGAHEAHCELRVRFTPADGGPPVYSKMARITIPGARPTSSAQRWQPERRRLWADTMEQTDLPLTMARRETQDAASRRTIHTTSNLSRTTTTIPLTSNSRMVQARTRLQRLAAQFAEDENTGGVQQASFETEEPAPRRYRLRGND